MVASPTDSELLVRIAAAKSAVLAQTALLHREFGRVESRWKSDGTRVTAVDVEISENIFRTLSGAFPEDQYFSEELGGAPGPIPVTARFSWVLDPIDGTNNYAAGLAHCAIALALLENGMPVHGVIYDHSRRVLMHGGPGFGMMDGDRRAGVIAAEPTGQSIIGFHSPSERRFAPHAQSITAHFKLRALGSSALHLAYVAAGIFDGTVDHNVKVWDIAAAVPMVLAAGGRLVCFTGDVFPLREFDLGMGRIFYAAGGEKTVQALRRVLQPV
ncbi:MAG: inositol monophosphatase [Opitutaceae bacterium]|nr:inositol monophosphatase [Opitutaceae bacterium]